MQLINLLSEIDSNSDKAGLIAIIMLASVIVFCAAWLIIKKIVLNKVFHMDEKFVKEYREKLLEREKQVEEAEKKKDSIGEDF